MQKTSEWFSNWFDSPYYHLLYFHRDDADARDFIDALILHLEISPDAHILDLACGRGRHAIYLNRKGFQVTGLDLSPKNISIAREAENEQLHFNTHDMRDALPGKYDLILNLFTSFGYFSSDDEHVLALRHISDALKPDGCFILDYMNADKVRRNLVTHNQTEINGVLFDLRRRNVEGFIEKDIRFTVDGRAYFFQERVRSFSKEELESLVKKAGLHVIDRWGNYELDPFHREDSDRLIFHCKN